MIKILLASFITILSFTARAENDRSGLEKIINGSHRSAENKHRDQYRHPLETLTFFDVKDTMTIVEIWPGEGWYTEILALYLREKGKLYAAHVSTDKQSPYQKDKLKKFLNKLKDKPKLYDKVTVTVLQPPEHIQIAPEGSADRILTFRNVHNWMKNDQAAAVFNAMYKALKPGGILGIVEHRASPIKPQDTKAASGYVKEDYVIGLARKAGFEFLAKSEINANPKDKKHYSEGVWTLPPSLKLKEKDKDKYLVIGESDRMTLKFLKPEPTTITSFLPKILLVDGERASLPQIPSVIHSSQ